MTDRLTPKIIGVFQEGYSRSKLKSDVLAGLTVAIVAMPLSMAIAIASGVTPDKGLFTAIVGGFLVSLFSGSRFQIGGPAGAFIVLVLATVTKHGMDGLILATAMSGVFLFLAGSLKLGKYIRFIPYPVTVGFTAGIAVIIFSSQIRDLFGLTIQGKEPGDFLAKILFLKDYATTANPAAVAIATATIAIILILRRFRPTWPGLLIAVVLASCAAALLHLNVETIGSRFGGIPRTLPLPSIPDVTFAKIIAVLPDAISFTLLGAIESLLSAVVADGMSGRRHRSSMELMGQGLANIGSALFGGICVTGTIARTATNVRSGAVSPLSGMLHSVFILLFMLVAAPLASYIPLASLAGVLAVVAWNMVEKPAIAALLRSSRGDALVLIATFLFVVFRDLTEGIIVGFSLGSLLFIDRMGKSVAVNDEVDEPFDQASPETLIYHVTGIFFFGAAASVSSVLDRVTGNYKNFILDCAAVPYIDSTAANVIESAVRKAKKQNMRFMIAGASSDVRHLLETHHVAEPEVIYANSVNDALSAIKSAS